MEIVALDVATLCGWARGKPGDKCPATGSIRFVGPEGASDWAVGKNALTWFSQFLAPEPRPTMLVMEAVLPAEALRGETNRAARDRLVSLQAILAAVALCRGLFNISTGPTQSARKQFFGGPFAKKKDVVEV